MGDFRYYVVKRGAQYLQIVYLPTSEHSDEAEAVWVDRQRDATKFGNKRDVSWLGPEDGIRHVRVRALPNGSNDG